MKVKFTALLITLMTVGFAGSLQAQMTFTFSDNGSGTTRITAIGSADLTGGQGAFTDNDKRLIGWDDISLPGNNDSFYLLADSSFFTFNEPNIGGIFNTFAASGDLAVGGIALESLEMDGTDSTSAYPFFGLYFNDFLPQAGDVTATGSAVVNFDFLNLPYFGQSFDLQGNTGDVIFSFDAIPEPTTVSLLGLSALAGVMLKRHRTRTNKKDVIPSKNMVEKW